MLAQRRVDPRHSYERIVCVVPMVFDHDDAVQQLEGDDHLAVVVEEAQPTLRWMTAAAKPPKEAELLKLFLYPGGSPARVLLGEALDQAGIASAN